jgi:hypothetical protein
MRLERLDLDLGELERQLVASAGVASWLDELGRKAVPAVQALAPERLGFLKGGVKHRVETNGANLRLLVYNDDFKAGWYEFGTERTAARPSLRPGVEAALPGARWGEARR